METLTELPLDQLHDSPFQPRTVYEGIEELAANIKAEGRVLQPLLVRPRVPPLFAGTGQADAAQTGYEIVFGHRRFRGAEAAGLASVPCIVRSMTDAQVRSAQMAENIQRDNMRALDEARGYRAMLDSDGGMTREQIAQHIGKSLSHVTGRLRLLTLCPEVMKALEGGEIKAEVALLVARVGNAKVQQNALQFIRGRRGHSELTDGGQASFRVIKDLLNERYTLELDPKVFDPGATSTAPSSASCTASTRPTWRARSTAWTHASSPA